MRALGAVEDDKGLAFGFQVGFGDDVDDLAVLGEELGEGLFELLDFDALFEVADVEAMGGQRGLGERMYVSGCNDTYVAFGGLIAMIAVCCEGGLWFGFGSSRYGLDLAA